MTREYNHDDAWRASVKAVLAHIERALGEGEATS